MAGASPSSGAHAGGSSDRALLARLCAGDAAAFDALVRRYWAPLVAYVHPVVQDRQAGEDIVQDVFVYLWRSRATLQPFGSVRALLYRSARHLALNERRRQRVRRRHAESVRAAPWRLAPPATPLELAERTELRRALETAIGTLPERRREVFVLGYVHALRHDEIAAIMEISVQTVKNQMSAALGELRRGLAGLLG